MDVLGYSLEEIAAIVQSTVPAVKASLHRGPVRLRELAEESRSSVTCSSRSARRPRRGRPPAHARLSPGIGFEEKSELSCVLEPIGRGWSSSRPVSSRPGKRQPILQVRRAHPG